MSCQEDVYLRTEANDFFARNFSDIQLNELGLRDNKQSIYTNIVNFLGDDLQHTSILEIGCCIGDLLSKFHTEHNSHVVGIEPSSLACEYAASTFSLPLLNDVFHNTEYFGFDSSHFQQFDIVIADDVLSWMSRHLILPVLSSIDWLVKPGGCIYLRDFCPSFDFAYPNHHQPGHGVYNFKVSGGHKKFFLNSGSYYVANEFVRIDPAFQKTKTTRKDSMIWSDSILQKASSPLVPTLTMTVND